MLKREAKYTPWQKLSGAGNTFVVLGPEGIPAQVDGADLARAICAEEGPGGGADGLMVISPSDDPTHFTMLYYNRDGSSGMMCGNGGRCAIRFAVDHGLVHREDNLRFTNQGVEYRGAIDQGLVRLSFPDPVAIRTNIATDLDGVPVTLHYVDVGTPHLILMIDHDETSRIAGNLADLDIDRWGPLLRRHPVAGDGGANANFLSADQSANPLHLRTFERGVEGETGACGTGALAAALIGALIHDLPSPVDIIPSSQDRLSVSFQQREDGTFTDLWLRGPAVVVDEGNIDLTSLLS